jgi:mRNA interferase RelE/StbE
VYEILTEGNAERDLKKLPAEAFHRIVAHLKALSVEPRPMGCRKITGSKSDWRIRVGEYRIIYEIDDRAETIKIMRVRHRREVYR